MIILKWTTDMVSQDRFHKFMLLNSSVSMTATATYFQLSLWIEDRRLTFECARCAQGLWCKLPPLECPFAASDLRISLAYLISAGWQKYSHWAVTLRNLGTSLASCILPDFQAMFLSIRYVSILLAGWVFQWKRLATAQTGDFEEVVVRHVPGAQMALLAAQLWCRVKTHTWVR